MLIHLILESVTSVTFGWLASWAIVPDVSLDNFTVDSAVTDLLDAFVSSGPPPFTLWNWFSIIVNALWTFVLGDTFAFFKNGAVFTEATFLSVLDLTVSDPGGVRTFIVTSHFSSWTTGLVFFIVVSTLVWAPSGSPVVLTDAKSVGTFLNKLGDSFTSSINGPVFSPGINAVFAGFPVSLLAGFQISLMINNVHAILEVVLLHDFVTHLVSDIIWIAALAWIVFIIAFEVLAATAVLSWKLLERNDLAWFGSAVFLWIFFGVVSTLNVLASTRLPLASTLVWNLTDDLSVPFILLITTADSLAVIDDVIASNWVFFVADTSDRDAATVRSSILPPELAFTGTSTRADVVGFGFNNSVVFAFSS